MQDYAEQIPVRDRWLIVAYVRALQLSQHATVDDVPADRRGALDDAGRAEPAAAPTERHAAGGETLASATTATSETFSRRPTLPGMQQFGMIAGVLGVVLAVAGFVDGRRASGSSRPTSSPTSFWIGVVARLPGAADGAAPVRRRLGHRAPPAVRGGGRARCR